MRKHLVSENSVCDLRRVQETHLKQSRLLCQHGSSKFKGFVTVQSAFQIKQNPEVLKNMRELARLRLNIYKSLDSVSCSEDSLLSAIMSTEEHTLGELVAILATSP